MAIITNDIPILEYSTQYDAVINPKKTQKKYPKVCLMVFFEEVFESFIKKYCGIKIDEYPSEVKKFPVYKVVHNSIELCVIQAAVAAGSIAKMTDWLYGKGIESIICCGGCGVLDHITAGDIIIPTKALRDEGASYKYLPPSRYIDIDSAQTEICKNVLDEYGVKYIECTTWTTDGFFRETQEMVEYRKNNDGCAVVEMECATMAAVAKFRNKKFCQLLYSGDILIGNDTYDDRCWYDNISAREKLFYLSLEIACKL